MAHATIPIVDFPQRGEGELLRAFVKYTADNPGKSFMVRRRDFDLEFIYNGKHKDGTLRGDIYIRSMSNAMTRHLMQRTQDIIQEVIKANGNQSG